MKARFITAVVCALSIWGAIPAHAFEYVCSAAGQAHCAAMNTSNGSSCITWVCQGGPPERPGLPNTGTCVQSFATTGVPCHYSQACIHAGTCLPGGICNPGPKQRQVCTDTPTGAKDSISCFCENDACQARMANGTPYPGNVSTMCTSTMQ
jgi:hypothetical protein